MVASMIELSESFASVSLEKRLNIATAGWAFIQEGMTILTHGCSRVVIALLLEAAAKGISFDVIVTEGHPVSEGFPCAAALAKGGIPVRIIADAAVGVTMGSVDLVIVGAEGVLEDGGIVNKVGTLQIAVLAKAMGKPFYVATESYKFARIYLLDQEGLQSMVGSGPPLPIPPPPDGTSSPRRARRGSEEREKWARRGRRRTGRTRTPPSRPPSARARLVWIGSA